MNCCLEYDFPGDEIPIIAGSALEALEAAMREMGSESILRTDGCGRQLYSGHRSVRYDKPFLMPIEDVFSITGRGTVVTGRVERGHCQGR